MQQPLLQLEDKADPSTNLQTAWYSDKLGAPVDHR